MPLTQESRCHGQRILIVDDDPDTAAMLKFSLEALGYKVEVASNGGEALSLHAAFAPAIALVDIGLPVMDGYELARRLLKVKADGQPLQLVALTGYGQERDRQRSKMAGFAKHLVKPVDPVPVESNPRRTLPAARACVRLPG